MACCHFQNYPGSWAIIRPVSELSIIRRSGRLRLTHIGIESRLGDPHHLTDFFHAQLFGLIELHSPLPFARR
jgi:hypothetical protein